MYKRQKYVWPLLTVVVVTGALFLREEVHEIHGVVPENFLTNGSLTIYASCLSVLMIVWAMHLTNLAKARKILEPLGINSLQIYLIHPGIMQLLERPRLVSLIKATYLGPFLSPALMLAITFGLIWILRSTKTEKLFFGRG